MIFLEFYLKSQIIANKDQGFFHFSLTIRLLFNILEYLCK